MTSVALAPIFEPPKSEKCFERAEKPTEALATQARKPLFSGPLKCVSLLISCFFGMTTISRHLTVPDMTVRVVIKSIDHRYLASSLTCMSRFIANEAINFGVKTTLSVHLDELAFVIPDASYKVQHTADMSRYTLEELMCHSYKPYK